MARNDRNKKSLVIHGALPVLVQLAGEGDITEQQGKQVIHCVPEKRQTTSEHYVHVATSTQGNKLASSSMSPCH